MKVERDYLWKRYTFIPSSKEDEKFLEVFNKYIDELEQENKNLKEYKSQRTRKIERENKKLKEELREVKWKLERIKQAYINFERTETDYNNMLWILDDVIMNR